MAGFRSRPLSDTDPPDLVNVGKVLEDLHDTVLLQGRHPVGNCLFPYDFCLGFLLYQIFHPVIAFQKFMYPKSPAGMKDHPAALSFIILLINIHSKSESIFNAYVYKAAGHES
jgi:hypothetical protein